MLTFSLLLTPRRAGPLLLLLLLPWLPGPRAQVYNGRTVQWQLSQPGEPRLQLRFGTAGLSYGYEGTAVVVENLTDTRLYVELELHLRDYCGQELRHRVRVTVKPHDKIGGSTWMGGDEQLDYSTQCSTSQAYSSTFRTKIASATLAIGQVRELAPAGAAPGAGGSTPGGGTPGNASGSSPGTTPGAGSPGGSMPVAGGAGTCPTFGFSLGESPTYYCMPLGWAALPTGTLSLGPGGQVRAVVPPTYSFTVQYRETGAPAWQSTELLNAGFNRFVLQHLNPCSRYEVRLLTHCNGQTTATPSPSLYFSTLCQAPSQLQVAELTATTVQLSSRTFFPVSCGQPVQVTAVVEYKADAGAWETLYCPGAPCRLTGLLPGTHYRARSRYLFNGRYYSAYSSEASFRTPAPAAQP